jgi:RNA recognition motif-containing protein
LQARSIELSFRNYQSLTNIFIGNLDFKVTEGQLWTLFANHGMVETVTIVKDRDTGRPRGFGFIEMWQPVDAQAAVSSLDGAFLNGRVVRVNEARPKLVQGLSDRSVGNRNHRQHHI